MTKNDESCIKYLNLFQEIGSINFKFPFFKGLVIQNNYVTSIRLSLRHNVNTFIHDREIEFFIPNFDILNFDSRIKRRNPTRASS